MIEILKKDIKALDFILEILSNERSSINVYDLKNAGHLNIKSKKEHEKIDISIAEENEFRRYISIIEKFKCGKSYIPKPFDGIENAFISSNPRTFQLYQQGGFKKIYKELKEKKKQNKIDLEKSKIDLKLAKETLKEFPKTKWFARIGFTLAVILAIKELVLLFFKDKII